MEPFIRSDQYNFIRRQTQILINGHATANDIHVLTTLKTLAKEKVFGLFEETSEEQEQLLIPIMDVKDNEGAEAFLLQVEPYVIPFQTITEQTIKKLFPKAKKLKVPVLENVNLKETSYVSWYDKGSNRKYIIARHNHKLKGLQGTFTSLNKKGICTLCNAHEKVGMFMSEAKGKGGEQGTFIKRGNYICEDSQKCNYNLITLDKLHDFIERLNETI
ncbi:FusB/FusC family EF-G-binding protein [Peribacillus sp. Hz7]|uniref:FusB/FusC family EF-G-binding protein n=1 Tax=Peribacillus sp. Hz7 TaxID=3344873 RepID=UPI0035CBC751